MAFRLRADNGPKLNDSLVALWFFRGSVLLRNPIFCDFSGGVRTPPPLWIRPCEGHMLCYFVWLRQNNERLPLRVCTKINCFLLLNQNICCGYSKNRLRLRRFFEHLKHKLCLLWCKQIFTILRSKIFLYLNHVF